MVGELELAWSLLQGEVLAISGTNGKTTTTTCSARIFENAGRVTHVRATSAIRCPPWR